MSLDRALSTLELTVLGIVLKRGPCIAHTVVNEFANSKASAYRSGAGSIYPLLNRLVKAELLNYDSRKYWLTEAGTEVLRDWLRHPGEVLCGLDELRSRVYFLKLLSLEEAEQFASESLSELQSLLKGCQETAEFYRQNGDIFSALAMSGTVFQTQARIDWMTAVRDQLHLAKD